MANTDAIAQTLVLFAKERKKVAQFYRQTLQLETIESDASHDLLRGRGIELVVHELAPRFARHIQIDTPPKPRDGTAFKPAFVVDDLARVATAARQTGGHLKALKSAWSIRGARVLDGWDPEGNVVQFKQPD